MFPPLPRPSNSASRDLQHRHYSAALVVHTVQRVYVLCLISRISISCKVLLRNVCSLTEEGWGTWKTSCLTSRWGSQEPSSMQRWCARCTSSAKTFSSTCAVTCLAAQGHFSHHP